MGGSRGLFRATLRRFRREQAAEHTAHELGRLLHGRLFRAELDDALDKFGSEFAVRILASTIHQGNFDFVALLDEPEDVLNFARDITHVCAGMELDFLDLRGLGVLACLFLPDALLVTELAVIHDLADGRLCGGRDFHKVEALGLGKALGLASGHHAEHLAFGINHAHLGHADFEVGTDERGGLAIVAFRAGAGGRKCQGAAPVGFLLLFVSGLFADHFDEGFRGHRSQVALFTATHRDNAGFGLAAAEHEHIGDLCQGGLADLGADFVIGPVTFGAEAGGGELGKGFFGDRELGVGDRHHLYLDGGQPRGEGSGIMLNENAEETFQRAEQRTVHHIGLMLLAVFAGVGKVETLGKVEVELNRAELPFTPKGILDLHVDLRAIEGATAFVNVVGHSFGFQGVAEGGGGLFPLRIIADGLLGFRGQVGGDVLKAKPTENAEAEAHGEANLVLNFLGGTENMCVVLREATHAEQAVAHAVLFVTIDGAELSPTQREVAVAPLFEEIGLNVEGAVHRLDVVRLLRRLVSLSLGHVHGREHPVLVKSQVAGGLPKVCAPDVRGEEHFVPMAEVLLAPVILNGHAHTRTLRQPVGKPRADALGDGEEFEFLAEFPVVTLLRLFDAGDNGIQLLLGGRGNAIKALKHLVVFVTAVVASGDAHQLYGTNASAVFHVRAAAEIHVVAGAENADGFAFGNVGQTLQFVGLILEKGLGLLTGDLFAHERQLCADELANRFFDRREILGAQAMLHVKVIIKPIIGGWTDVNLHVVKQRTDCRRHQVRRTVPDFFNRRAHRYSLKIPADYTLNLPGKEAPVWAVMCYNETMITTHAEGVVFTGISGCFGGAPTPKALWKAILRRQSFFVPRSEAAGVAATEVAFAGHELPEVCAALGERFACRTDHIPLPPDLGIGDNPDFWFGAQLLHDALLDAGLPPENRPTDRMALFVGYEPAFNPAAVNWLWHASVIGQVMSTLQRFFPGASYARMEAVRTELADTLPLLKRRQLEMARGEGVVRGLAQAFGACDTACLCTAGEASVFAGLDAAANALRMGQCDVAAVLVLQPPISQAQLLGEAALMPFSSARELLPFTERSSGTLPGEGGAAFVLRRAGDVRAQGGHVYAGLHGCALVSGLEPEGGGLTESLRRALHRALRRLPNGFRDIDYWEMNASGIPAEDAAEETLLNRMTANRGAHIPLLAVGSAKTSFGHTLTAAGALGVLKGILSVSHCVLPPSVTPVDDSFRLREPEQSYYWVQQARPWIASSMRPRRLAVSTLAASGRAGAVVLEEAEQ